MRRKYRRPRKYNYNNKYKYQHDKNLTNVAVLSIFSSLTFVIFLMTYSELMLIISIICFIGTLYFYSLSTSENSNSQSNQFRRESRELYISKYSSPDLSVTYLKEPVFNNFVVLDLETTGLSPYYDRIIEIGAQKYLNGILVDEFSTLVDPEIKIPVEASNVNGIKNSMVYGKPKIHELQEKFISFLDNHIVVAHNAPFDIGFLKSNFSFPIESLKAFDTLKFARNHYDFENNKLETLCHKFKIQNNNKHRALGDVEATAKLLKSFSNDFIIKDPLNSAKAFETHQQIDKAIELYENIIENKFESKQPFNRLVSLYRANNDIPNELRVLKKAVSVFETLQGSDAEDVEKMKIRFENRIKKLEKL